MKRKILSILFSVFLILPAVFFLFTGFSWLVSPDTAAENLMMPMLKGVALNSQIADIGGMFLAMGLVVMSAVVTRKGPWLMPISVLLGSIALYRLLAFAIHGALLVPQMIVFEAVLALWFAFASTKLGKKVPDHG